MRFHRLTERTDPLAMPRAAIAIAAVLAALYLAGIPGQWWPSPDSALYLGLAGSLAAGEGYVFNGELSTTVTPGLPCLLAGVELLLGENIYAANALIALCALAMLTLVWRVAAGAVGRFLAPVVLLAVAMSYPVFHAAHMILTDIPFAALAWLAVRASLRLLDTGRWRWLIILVAACAAGVLIRAPGILFFGALAAGVAVHQAGRLRWRGRLVAAAAVVVSAALVLLGLLVLARSITTGDGQPLYVAHSRQQLAGLAKVLVNLRDGLGELPRSVSRLYSGQEFVPLGLLVIGLWLWGCSRAVGSGRAVLAVTSVVYVLSLVTLGGEIGARSRYVLQVWPMMAILIALGSADVAARVSRRRGKELTPRGLATVPVVVLAVGIAINAPRTLRNAVYYGPISHTDRYYDVIRDGDHRDLLTTARTLRTHWTPGTTILASGDDVSMLHYLTGRRVHSLPTGDAFESIALPASDAALYRQIAEDTPGRTLIVVDLTEGSPAFRTAWKQHLADSPGLRPLPDTGQYSIAVKQ